MPTSTAKLKVLLLINILFTPTFTHASHDHPTHHASSDHPLPHAAHPPPHVQAAHPPPHASAAASHDHDHDHPGVFMSKKTLFRMGIVLKE